MDGDGDLDIVSASFYDDTIAWYENNGAADPTFTKADIATSADGRSKMFMWTADMDGDGDMDIVSASHNDDTLPGMKMMEQQIQHLLLLISLQVLMVL